jgi:hypothetical protein
MQRFKLMQWMKYTGILLCLFNYTAGAQVTGGRFAMEYLRLPNAPHISALGGMNVANTSRDISFALQNPALMRPALHNELGLSMNKYYADISIANLQYGYHVPTINTSFALGIQYLNYGTFTQTDNIGNEFGEFRARDYAISLAGSRQYNEHFRYGATLKFAQSMLYDKKASALLADVGINYYDSSSLLDIGVVAKNIGFMMSKYTSGNPAEPMPFDLQIGISKQFAHLPLRLFTTIHHLYEWDIRYSNPADLNTSSLFGSQNDSLKEAKKSHFADKLFRHFIFGGELTFGKRVTLTFAYNHLRRSEMVLKERTATAGFSFGGGINLNKFQVYYARSYYHVAGAYNEFGLNMSLHKLFGVGKLNDKIHWNNNYPDWQ